MVAFGASTLAHLAAGKERLMHVTAPWWPGRLISQQKEYTSLLPYPPSPTW